MHGCAVSEAAEWESRHRAAVVGADTEGAEAMSEQVGISATPRYDRNDPRNQSCIADALADLTIQVARIANVLEYQVNIDPATFPDTRDTND